MLILSTHRKSTRQRGLSLVEVLLSLAISAMLLVATIGSARYELPSLRRRRRASRDTVRNPHDRQTGC